MFVFSDKIEKVQIDLEAKKVYVTSAELNANELLEKIKKTGKETSFVGVKNAWALQPHRNVINLQK